MLSDMSQTEKDKYCLTPLIWEQQQHQRPKLTDTENRLVVARGGGGLNG